jgi:ribosomal protein L28
MATKVCALCGKSNISGRRIQHHAKGGWRYKAPKTLRKFKANLRKIDLEVGTEVIRTDICMKCYKKLRKEAK